MGVQHEIARLQDHQARQLHQDYYFVRSNERSEPGRNEHRRRSSKCDLQAVFEEARDHPERSMTTNYIVSAREVPNG
jgi:hypothetical protein